MAKKTSSVIVCAWSVAVSLAAASCATPFDRAKNTPLARVEDNYVSLVSGLPALYSVMASAVVVAPGIAVTSAHVLDVADRYSGYTASADMFTVETVAVSDRMDLAVLKVPGHVGKPFAWDLPRRSDPVWAMGTTNILHAPVVAGQVLEPDGWACEKLGKETETRRGPDRCETPIVRGIMYQAEAGPGYSGGPLVNSEGRLLGLTQGTFFEVVDREGRAIEGAPRTMFAYRIGDVLVEVRRLLKSGSHGLSAQEVAAPLAYLDRVIAALDRQSASLAD